MQAKGSLDEFDWNRSATFILWTLYVTFAIDVLFYTHLFARWFPTERAGRKIWSNVAKVSDSSAGVERRLLFRWRCFLRERQKIHLSWRREALLDLRH